MEDVMDITAPDLGFGGVDGEVDLDLFDIDGEDYNEFTRYIRPRMYSVPERFVRYENAQNLAKDIVISDQMPRYDCFISGNFIFGDFIEAFLRRNNCKCTDMIISTLSMSQENIDSLRGLIDHGFIDQLTIIVSVYFFSHERHELIPYIYEQLDINNRLQLAVADVHTKTCQFKTLGGKKIVIHGSSNMRSSGNIEQFTVEWNDDLYDFYEDTFLILADRYKTINKPVRGKEAWNGLEKEIRN